MRMKKSKGGLNAKFAVTAACVVAVMVFAIYFTGAGMRSFAEEMSGRADDETAAAATDAGTEPERVIVEEKDDGGAQVFNFNVNVDGGAPETTQPKTDGAEPLAAVTPVALTAEHEHKWVAATCTLPAVCRICGLEGEPAHGHVWTGATCTEPSACAICGYMGEGAQGHKWIEATCEHPKMCSVCGETEGDPAPHSWAAATCTKPKTCTVCGQTSGEPKGHQWKSATCTTPEICKVCGKTQGKAKGHTWVEASTSSPKRCKVCGATEGDKLPNGIKVAAMKYTDADLELLARLIYLEAGGGSKDGMWAVGTVVINRVRSSKFPNTLEGVIYAKGQFTVTGKIDKTTPSSAAVEAAKRVLSGDLYDSDIMYFKSANSSKSWGSRKYCFRVGNNYFYT